MKRWMVGVWILVVAVSTGWVTALAATQDVCGGVEAIPLTDRNVQRLNSIQTALTNYQRYSCQNSVAYCLCFTYPDGNLTVGVSDLSLNSAGGGKPVYIVNLKIPSFRGQLALNGTYPITLLDSSLNGCTNCISMTGASHRIENTQIACASKESGGVGIKLIGEDHHIVDNTDIQNCAVGVQMGDANNTANNNIIDHAKIHNNGIGIKVANGNGNFFRANAVYDNDANNDGLFAGAEGILLEDGANGAKQPPIMLAADGGELQGEISENKPFLIYPKEVKDLPENGTPVNAIFRIKAATRRGELEIFLTGKQKEDPDTENYKQGMTFYNKPKLLSAVPDGLGNYTLTYQMPMSKPFKDKYVVTVLHFRSFGSTTYSNLVELNPPSDPGLISAPSMDDLGVAGEQVAVAGAPGEIGGGDGGGNVVAGDPAPLPSSPVEDDDQKSSSQEMGVASPSGDGGAAQVVSGGAGGTGAPGGVGVSAGGCGGNIATAGNSQATLPFAALLVIFTGLLFLISIRCNPSK